MGRKTRRPVIEIAGGWFDQNGPPAHFHRNPPGRGWTPNAEPSHCANFFAYSHCRYLAGFFKDTENDYSNHGWRPEHMFRPDRKQRRQYSLDERKEADFPSLTVVDGKCYELSSGGTFDEVEK
jgi:hypothetical protein